MILVSRSGDSSGYMLRLGFFWSGFLVLVGSVGVLIIASFLFAWGCVMVSFFPSFC